MNSTDVREDSVQFLRGNFAQIFALTAPLSALMLGVTYLMAYQFTGAAAAVITAVFDLFAYAYIEAVTIIYIRQVLAGAPSGYVTVLGEAVQYWARLSLLKAIKIVAIVVGFILLIVPGILIAVRLSIAEQALVLENSKVRAALETSNDMTKPIFGLVFGSLGVLFLVTNLIFVGLNYASTYISEYLALVLFPVFTAISSVMTIAAYRIYSHVSSEGEAGA